MDLNSFVVGYKQGKNSAGNIPLGLAFGDEPPKDTRKLWVKTEEPSGVTVSKDFEKETLVNPSFTTSVSLPADKNHTQAGVAVVDGLVYIFGGGKAVGSSNSTTTKEIECYDPATKTFTTLGVSMPEAIYGMACVEVGRVVYLFGGSAARTGTSSYRSTIYRFDVDEQTFTTLSARLTYGNANQKAVLVGTNIYIFSLGYNNYISDKIYCFDTITETIAEYSLKMPGVYSGGIPLTDGRYIYYYGGTFDNIGSSGIKKIDVETNTITQLDFTSPISASRIIMVGSRMVMLGTLKKESVTGFCVFDTATMVTETYTLQSMYSGTLYALTYANLVAIGDDVHIVFGDNGNSTSMANVFIFKTPSFRRILPHGHMQLDPSISSNKFMMMDRGSIQVEMGVNMVLKGNENDAAEPVDAALYKNDAWVNI